MGIDPTIPCEIVGHLLPMFSVDSAWPQSGGLSGAKVWRCTSSRLGPLCLRQWPSLHPTPDRLLQIHRSMQYASEHAIDFVPKLCRDTKGNSFWRLRDHLWEMTQWLPGVADYLAKPSERKLISACNAIAQLHGVWQAMESYEAIPPSVLERQGTLAGWLHDPSLVEKLGKKLISKAESDLCMDTIRLLKTLGPSIAEELNHLVEQPILLQPVLRDAWNDHLLFYEEQIVGIIDYGAVRIDDPAIDLARMLGSLEPFDGERRSLGVATYNARRLHNPVSQNRVDFLDRCGTLLTALQWMHWLVLERRRFSADPASLVARWQRAILRLRQV
jgi:Phosphotransferase enzyme family